MNDTITTVVPTGRGVPMGPESLCEAVEGSRWMWNLYRDTSVPQKTLRGLQELEHARICVSAALRMYGSDKELEQWGHKAVREILECLPQEAVSALTSLPRLDVYGMWIVWTETLDVLADRIDQATR